MFADVDYSQFDSVQEAVAYLNRRIRETPPTDEPIHQILNRFHRHIDEKLGLAGAMPLTVQLQIIEHEVDVITAPSTPGADDYHQNPNDPFADSGTLSEEGSPSSPSSTRPTASVGGVPAAPGMPGPRRPSTPLDEHAAPIKILDDDVPSPPKPIATRKEPKKEPKKAPVKEEVPKKVPGPAPPPRRKAKLQRPEPESGEAEAEADQDEAQREKKRPEKKHAHGDEIEVSSDDDEAKAKIKRHRQATEEPAPGGDQGQLTGPSRKLLEDGAGLLDVVLSQTPCQRAQLPLALIDPCPNPARPLSCDRMKAIFGYFQQFGWAALFSLSVQKAAAGERFEVVDGSHRYAVARLIVDPNRVSELPAHITQDERQELRDLAMNLNKEYPKVKNHLANELVNVVLLENMDEDALLVFQATCNAMTADDSFGSSGYDVLLNVKRAALRAPQLYSLTNPDLPARLKPALKALHFPDSKDAYIKLTKIVGLCSVEQLTALSQTPIQSHLTRSNLWRIFETKDVLFNQFLIARMLQPDFNGSTLATPDLPKFKLPIRQAEQAWLLMARHDEAALARHEPHPLLLLPPDEPTRKILLGKLFQLPEFEYFNPLLVRPLPTKLGHPVLPEYSEELGAVGCPFSGLNWDDLVHLPNYILDLNIGRGSIRIQIKFECALSSKNELYSRNLWLSSVAIQCHKEARKRQLSVDICSLVDFIAQHAPKDFSEHLSSYLFPTLTPFTIRVLDRYPELKSDPHYRSMRNSKSESRFPPPKPKKASVQPLTSKKVPDPPASDHAFAPPTPTPMVVQHSGHCESTPPPPPLKRSAPRERHRPQPPAPLVPPPPFPYGPVIPLEAVPIRQLVPVVPLGATPETLDSGDPGPPQPRARRRRRR
ncbi:hypothetical protein PAPYR_12651 [Paratrimastix pyriformis]|uniref:ParB/Sulfiredoxin domain-containing protein n=1 Tax=Paratrimastix pyriformis TaxID=342808 RepID=A0ABQ8U5A3_9EUKA|nr:hypothetical protein PAPYR_12651 [Paratrimastix pyriformis]